MAIGKLESVPLRELWKHEEHGFSAYLTNLEAKTAIWITSEPRPEHIRAVAWLNEVTPEDIAFYLVRIEACRIGNSDPAPRFTVIIAPSKEAKELGEERKDIAKQHEINKRFWEQLLTRAEERGVTLHAERFPIKGNALNVNAGKPGLSFGYVIWPEDEEVKVQLYIDTEDKDTNKRFYDLLYTNKQKIETDFGGTLRWFLPGNRSYAYIRYPLEKQDLEHENNWSSIQYAMIDAMGRLSRALKPHIQALPE